MDWTANLSGGCLIRLGSCLKNAEFMVVIAAPVSHKKDVGRSQILPGIKGH
jgi:hypothetical protein